MKAGILYFLIPVALFLAWVWVIRNRPSHYRPYEDSYNRHHPEEDNGTR